MSGGFFYTDSVPHTKYRGYGFGTMAYEKSKSGILSDTSCKRVTASFPIKTVSWCDKSADFDVPNTMQLGEYSTSGGRDDLSYIFVANVNVNSDGHLNVNVNPLSNDNVWNAENRHRFVVPQLTVSPAPPAGVLLPILSSNRRSFGRFLRFFRKCPHIVLLK